MIIGHNSQILLIAKAKNTITGRKLASAPPLNGNIRLRYENEQFYKVNDYWAQLESRIVDAHDGVDRQIKAGVAMDDMVSIMPVFTALPTFAYFNFRTGFSLKESFVEDKNTILFAIENILNKAYTEPMSFQRIQPGRSFKLFLTTEF